MFIKNLFFFKKKILLNPLLIKIKFNIYKIIIKLIILTLF